MPSPVLHLCILQTDMPAGATEIGRREERQAEAEEERGTEGDGGEGAEGS